MKQLGLLGFLAISACLTLALTACGSSTPAARDGGLVGETAQTGDAEAQNADADSLGSDACPPPTEGDPCSADAAVCFVNSCCGIPWVCTDGKWAYGMPCPCAVP
jgi:hypothetical protein